MRYAIMMLLMAVLASPSMAAMGDLKSGLLTDQQDAAMGQLDLSSGKVYFPWSDQQKNPAIPASGGIMPVCCPAKENINMKGSTSQEQVADLKAVNSIKERNIVYGDRQVGSADEGIGNSMEVSVVGDADNYQGGGESMGAFGDFGIEKRIDEVLSPYPHSVGSTNSRNSQPGFGSQDQRNYMDIDVSGITVTAINTVPNGNAVATSNIIIKPVQIIECPSEADQKLI